MRSDQAGTTVGFDPIGVTLQPGQTVCWICNANVHTTTAYSPKNENHSLRIPQNASLWASNHLLPGRRFDVKLTVEGVYDYFCLPHEQGGMVDRLMPASRSARACCPSTISRKRGKLETGAPRSSEGVPEHRRNSAAEGRAVAVGLLGIIRGFNDWSYAARYQI